MLFVPAQILMIYISLGLSPWVDTLSNQLITHLCRSDPFWCSWCPHRSWWYTFRWASAPSWPSPGKTSDRRRCYLIKKGNYKTIPKAFKNNGNNPTDYLLYEQCFGSALVICGSGYGSGSSIFDECGSGSRADLDPDSGKHLNQVFRR
jgi:hypothetical protein